MNTIFTLGYSGRHPQEIDDLVKFHNAYLFDIRYSPRSMNPVWSRKQFIERLGNRYLHVIQFGNTNYKNYKNDGIIDIVDIVTGTKILENYLSKNNVILMCGCKHYNHCHRREVAMHLMIKGYDVIEVRDIKTMAHQPPLSMGASPLYNRQYRMEGGQVVPLL